MRVYPEIESWNEFYPSEIFVLMGENDTNEDVFPVYKNANIGTTIYVGSEGILSSVMTDTVIVKKIGDIEVSSDIDSNMILIGNVSYGG